MRYRVMRTLKKLNEIRKAKHHIEVAYKMLAKEEKRLLHELDQMECENVLYKIR